MDRKQLLQKIDKAWVTIKESYSGLAGAKMVKHGIAGDWAVKDILAHVTTWEEESLKYLPLILDGRRTPRYSSMYGGIDSFNAQMSEQKRSLSLSNVLMQFDETHQRLIDYLQNVPEEQFARETPFRRRLRLDTYSHYLEHSKMIQTWRERSG